MINPTLNRASEKNIEITDSIKKLFQVIYNEKEQKDDDDDAPKIKVSSLISKMAFYYEKIRNSVDYKEEHLLRKNAIMRILKRQIVIEGAIQVQNLNSEEVSKHLLVELIRAGYLPNNKILEIKIGEVAVIIEKYIKLRNYSLLNTAKDDFKARNGMVNFILATAASELEESLGIKKVDQVIVSDIYEILKNVIRLPEESAYVADKDIQIYIGIHKNLLKFDNDMIGFILFKYYNGKWKESDDEDIERIGKNIVNLRQAITDQINHPLTGQMTRVISRYAVYFTILKGVIEENPVKVYNNFKIDSKAFPREIKNVCKKKYDAARAKLWRAGVRSIIYIFLTKSMLAIILEVPATQLFGEQLNMFALIINIIFPAALLFIIILFTKLPEDNNTQKIIEGINSLVFANHKTQEPITLRPSVKRGVGLNYIFGVVYSAAFLISIGAIIYALDKIGFNFVSIAIFLFFLAFVSFFAIRIRKGASELIIIERKESIFSFLIDFFYIPIVAAGKWLSEKFSRLNVFVFVLDFIIEAPFKIFVEIAEEWTKYVKERRDQIM